MGSNRIKLLLLFMATPTAFLLALDGSAVAGATFAVTENCERHGALSGALGNLDGGVRLTIWLVGLA